MKIIKTQRVVKETTRIGNSSRQVTMIKSPVLFKNKDNKKIGSVARTPKNNFSQHIKPCMGCRRKSGK
jgi:hypothetical protein